MAVSPPPAPSSIDLSGLPPRVVSAFIATAFAQETPEAASVQWRAVADQIRPKVSKLAAIMDDAETDVLAYMTFVWTPPGTQGPI